MATMNVSLPDPMKDWVETQIETGRYAKRLGGAGGRPAAGL